MMPPLTICPSTRVWHCLSALLLSWGDSSIRILVIVVAVDVCERNSIEIIFLVRPREIVSTDERRMSFENNLCWCSTWIDYTRIVCHGNGERAIDDLEAFSVNIALGDKCRILFKNCGYILIFLCLANLRVI